MNLSDKIRKIRENRGLSQARFGKRIGVSSKSISAYETGRSKPSTKVLDKLLDSYGIDILLSENHKAQLASHLRDIESRFKEIEDLLAPTR